jgi:diguanylate cyclase (GGDEF)-like protein
MRSASGSTTAELAADYSDAALHPAVDALADVLRSLGQHAFDLDTRSVDDIERCCEQWARHILLGVPPVGTRESVSRRPAEQTQWGALCRDISTLRCDEKQFVENAAKDFRSVLARVARQLQDSIDQSNSEDNEIVLQLERIRRVTQSTSLVEIRDTLADAVSMMSNVLGDRRTRERRELEELNDRLSSVRGQLTRAKQDLDLDPMTKLYNRAAFERELNSVVTLNVIAKRPTCLLLVDIDHFKGVNDNYGHTVGDSVIHHVTENLIRSFPRKTDFVARYGGDEFAAILQDVRIDDGMKLAQRLLDRMRGQEIRVRDNDVLRQTLSIGVAALLPGDTDAKWLDRADNALYKAKQRGRDGAFCERVPIVS